MPDRKKLFGCIEKANRPTETEELDGIEYKYWNCPLQFVPPNIWDWYKIYRYVKEFNGQMPAYEDVNSRFLQACMYYEGQKNMCLNEKAKRGN
jgi:hypothetical protein